MTVSELGDKIRQMSERRGVRVGSLHSPTAASDLFDDITVHTKKNAFTPTSLSVEHHAVDGTTVTFEGNVDAYERPRYCCVDDPRESVYDEYPDRYEPLVVEILGSMWTATEYMVQIDMSGMYPIEVTISKAEKH